MKPTLKKFLLLLLAIPLSTATSMAFAEDGGGSSFANFADIASNSHFAFTKTSTGGTFGTLNDAVNFQYLITGLSTALTGNQAAHLTMTSSTTDTSTNGVLAITGDTVLHFTRDVSLNGKNNLLTVTIKTDPNSGAGSPQIAASGRILNFDPATPDQIITYTSDFLTFKPNQESDISLAISGFRKNQTFATSFTLGSAVGTFNQDLPIATPPVPEPASYAMMFLGLGFISFKARRKSSKKTNA